MACSGVLVAGLVIWLSGRDPAAFTPSVVPLSAPTLPLSAALAVLIGLIPASAAPTPPRSTP